MVMEELQAQDHTGRVKPVGTPRKVFNLHPATLGNFLRQWTHEHIKHGGFQEGAHILLHDTHAAELTQHVAQKRRRHVCASWGLLLLCTPWQNTHVLVSGNMQTSWPRRGGGSRWRSQRSVSHTSDWRQGGGRAWDSSNCTRCISDVNEHCHVSETQGCSVRNKSYLSTSSLATMSPFFRALMAYRLPVSLYSDNKTWREEKCVSQYFLTSLPCLWHPLSPMKT